MKKIKIITFSILAAWGLGTFSGCTDGFEELNTNPNQSSKALPETLLAPAITEVVKRNQDRALRITNELMQVHVSRTDNDDIHRYNIRSSESDYMWNNWYTELTNFRDIYTSADETQTPQTPTFKGISLICEVWVWSLLTDMFGDIPYTMALRGREGILQPRFDKQENIYVDLFLKLEEANTLLKTNINLSATQVVSDPIFQGVASNWRRFGNSLYLRLLLRVSAKSDPVAGVTAVQKFAQIVNDPGEYPIMTSNAQSAILKFTGTVPYQSAFHTYRIPDFNGFHSLSEFFVDNLLDWNDPRIGKWATLSGGVYEGIPSGYAVGQVPGSKSTYLSTLMTEPLLGNILNYSELQFILAEGAAKGWITGSAKTFYEAGVTNHITLWGLTVPANYLATPGVKFEDNFTLTTKMELIHVQKYYSLFFTDFQQWYEYRRTGLPNIPKGPGLLNNGQMPSRLSYPVYVQSLNQANYTAAVADQGPDNINTKVWWQQ